MPDAELDDLLTRNVLAPEVLEAALGELGIEPEAVPQVAEPTAPATRAERLRGLLGAAEPVSTQAQAISPDVAPASAPAAPAPLTTSAPDVGKTEVLPAAETAIDDRPDPPVDIRYGKRRASAVSTGDTARAQARVDRMFKDELDPSNPYIETREEGGRLFVENRLTREAIDTALTKAEDRAGHMLRSIAAQDGIRPEQKWLAEKLAPIMKDLGVKLVAAPPVEQADYGGAYNNLRNELWVRQAAPTVALHEALHGATSALLEYKTGQQANPTLGRVRQEFDDMLAHLRQHVADNGVESAPADIQGLLENRQGPLANVKELLAYGMTEESFQGYLKTVPAPPNRSGWRNLWEAFKSAIRAVMGGDKLTADQRSFLDALIESTGELVDFAEANPAVAKIAQKSEASRIAKEQFQRASKRSKPDSEIDPQTVFHGTPHSVEKFSLQKIGTGEGAQAYGWGLYFASKKEVAEWYRSGLSNRDLIRKAREAYDEFTDPQDAVDALREEGINERQAELLEALQEDDWLGFDYPHQAISAAFREPDNFDLSERTKAALANQGNLYQVDIPEDSDLLDYDKPLSQQPEKVQNAIDEMIRAAFPAKQVEHIEENWGTLTGSQLYKLAESIDLDMIVSSGGNFSEDARSEAAQITSLAFSQFGIPGLRYLDGNSRNKGDGSYNYVIWDEGAVSDPESVNDRSAFRKAPSYTPEQEAFLTKAGLPVDKRGFIRRRLDGLREEFTKVKDAAKDVDALKQALFDNLHGLRAAEARLGLDDPETSPYVAARMTRGLASQMEALLTFGAPKWDGNAMSVDRNTRGLLDALKPVEGKVDEWLGWMVARRAQVLKAQGRENLMSDTDIQAGLSLAGNDTTAFQQAAREYLKVKNAVLDLAQEAGLIDPQARAAWDHAEYIPFYRQEGGAAAGPGTRRGLEGQSSGIRSLKGGEQALADPLANIIRNFTRLVDAAGKNRATLLAVDRLGPTVFTPASREFKPALIPLDQVKKHLLDTGVPQSTIDTLPAGALKGVQQMLSIQPPSGEEVVRVMREGKPEYYEVSDPLVLRALTAFKEPNKSWGIKPFIFFKRLLTQGVTTTADFVAANFLRDMGSAWVISDDRFKPGWDSIKGVINTLRVDKASQDMMMAGGAFMGGNFYGGDPDAAAAALRRALRTKGLSNRDIEGFIGTIAHTPLKLWDAYMKLSSGVENSNRRAVYDAALKAGRSPAEAAYMARDLMDFSMQGDAKFMQFFSDVLPFFNARVQGLYKLGRRAATPAGKKAILLRGSVLMMGSVALYAWNVTMHGDAYDDLEEWDKDAYWHIAPGTPYHTRIPKPFEVGLAFATVPERMLEAIRFANTGEEGDTPSETWDALVRAITGTLAFNPIPQAALPVVEQWANKRFFTGRPIESQGDDKLLPEAREEWYTSDTAKKIAKALPETGPAALSAKRIQHLWQGYTGGMGAYVLDASDWVVRQLDDAPVRPTVALRDFPVMGRFLRGDTPAPSKAVGEFYDRLSRAEQVEGTIKEYFVRDASDDAAKAGDLTDRALELQRENAALLGPIYYSKRLKAGFGFRHIQAMRKVRTQLAGLKQEAEDIINSTKLSAEQKREQLDANTVKRNKLARDMVGKLKDARKTPDDKANDGDADAGQE